MAQISSVQGFIQNDAICFTSEGKTETFIKSSKVRITTYLIWSVHQIIPSPLQTEWLKYKNIVCAQKYMQLLANVLNEC